MPRPYFYGNGAAAQCLVRRTAERLGECAIGLIPTIDECQLTAIFPTLVTMMGCTVPSPGVRLAEIFWGLKMVADANGTATGATPS